MDGTDFQVDLLARLLDVSGLRHTLIAQNVANVNTPGYRQRAVEFEEALGRALTSGQRAPALAIEPKVVEPQGLQERGDGNNVDIDVEMGQLSKNTILYRVYGQLLSGKLAMMRSAVTGR